MRHAIAALVLLALDVYPLRRLRFPMGLADALRVVLAKWPFVLLAALLALYTYVAVEGAGYLTEADKLIRKIADQALHGNLAQQCRCFPHHHGAVTEGLHQKTKGGKFLTMGFDTFGRAGFKLHHLRDQ